MRHWQTTLESIRFSNNLMQNKPINDTEFQDYCLNGIFKSQYDVVEEMNRLSTQRTAWQKLSGMCPKEVYFDKWIANYDTVVNQGLCEQISRLDWYVLGMRQARRVSCDCHEDFSFAVKPKMNEIAAVIKKIGESCDFTATPTGYFKAHCQGHPVVTGTPLVVEIDLSIDNPKCRRVVNAVAICLGLGFQVTHENGETFLRQQSTLHDPNPSISNFAGFNAREITIPR